MWPAWTVREHGGDLAWFHVLLAFPDGARVDALAVLSGGSVSVEDVSAEPALSLADLKALPEWIEAPLFTACGVADGAGAGAGGSARPSEESAAREAEPVLCDTEPALCDAEPARLADLPAGAPPGCATATATATAGRARQAWPRGTEGRRLAAEEYRAAQRQGTDPVLAVMSATGHGRRRSLKLIAQARDAGFLTPRHARR
ncbi:DUF6214 family protein [Streptomyces sp. LP11]|uniref:DUF6214 family protein n=1 Tax=Streptomyces pyxinicus TaxID=2970331 RepID=A0ABT2AYZ7_9ACTN|nr:DUF6214 family protein [Streptomyces sp. LP11]MCS0600933.1 DUF6214 family protein [Streptomyces sp. LP11]